MKKIIDEVKVVEVKLKMFFNKECGEITEQTIKTALEEMEEFNEYTNLISFKEVEE